MDEWGDAVSKYNEAFVVLEELVLAQSLVICDLVDNTRRNHARRSTHALSMIDQQNVKLMLTNLREFRLLLASRLPRKERASG